MKEFLTLEEARNALNASWLERWGPVLQELCVAVAAAMFCFFMWYIVGKKTISDWWSLVMLGLALGGIACLFVPFYRYYRRRQRLRKVVEEHTYF